MPKDVDVLQNEIIIMEIDFLWNFGCSGYNMTVDLGLVKIEAISLGYVMLLLIMREEILESGEKID